MKKPEELVQSMTTQEKASLTSGLDFWHSKGVESADVPSIMLTDGPHGVRKQRGSGDHVGLEDSVPATCFPPAVALGSTWDPALAHRVGVALGEEAKAEGVGVLLGPGINIKRSPLGGRNFEYFSEDPHVSGVMAAALVNGLQSQGVGSSLKHFAANNQETDRLRVSVDIDERPLREIYLRAFQHVVAEARPWTLMCSYNKINGVYASEDPWLLTSVLRDEWGFDGLVVSDWGAVNNRVEGLKAGLDLEMPANGGVTDAEIVAAIADGSLDESVLDTAAERMVSLVQKAVAGADSSATYNATAHHELAREAAARSIVLLKNDDGLLPLGAETSVAVIGEFARTPRYQGAGSSLINPTQLDNALEFIKEHSPSATFSAGYTADGSPDASLAPAAVEAARAADVVLLFLGLPGGDESEGFDRTHLELPVEQTELLEAVFAANPRTVVVLSNGSVVRLSGWAQRIPAIVEGWLLGQGGGKAIADVLYGTVNPSGRLAETIPVRLEDTPAYLNFPGENSHVRYGEGLFVGYRYYDARGMEVSYPFGHGLSYTTFEMDELRVTSTPDAVDLAVRVRNTGAVAGREIVQLYVSLPGSKVVRVPRELRAFAVVDLAVGESKQVTLSVKRSDLGYFSEPLAQWVVEGGDYLFEVGASSRDIRQSATATVAGDPFVMPLDSNSTLEEWMTHPKGGPVLKGALDAAASQGDQGGLIAMLTDPGFMKLVGSMPLARIAKFPGSPLTADSLAQLVAAANA